MPRPTLDICIVNWNTGPLLRECLASIAEASAEGLVLSPVIVVDNASADGSADHIETLGLPVRLVCNPTNRGFAAACNQAAKGSHADYLLFLNPDTRLFRDTLSQAVGFLERQASPEVSIVGVQLVDAQGSLSRTCSRFPTPGSLVAKALGLDRILPTLFPPGMMTDWDHAETREVDQVMGAFFLIRRSVFEALAGFDERFFVYFEDLDLSLRARRAGFRSVYLAEARTCHRGAGSSDRVKATRLSYSLGSRILYAFKHFHRLSAIMVLVATLVVEPATRAVLAILRGSRSELCDTARGYCMLWWRLPDLVRATRPSPNA